MNDPWDWTEDDLLTLIASGEKESITLDYKRSDSLQKTDGRKNEISKDVSALANSAGGTLVYGMAEDGYVPKEIDGGVDPAEITKEWLDQVITSRIQRRINGVRINQVDLRTSAPGRVAYIVYVPQSLRAPHQAADRKFYKRHNFESIPMEEYEIRDVAHRSESPDLRMSLKLHHGLQVPLVFSDMPSHSDPVDLAIHLKNDSPAPADYAALYLGLAKELRMHDTGGFGDYDGEVVVAGIPPSQIQCKYRRWGIKNREPLFEDNPVFLDVFSVRVPAGEGKFSIAWDIRAPRMSPRHGILSLESDGKTVSLREAPGNE